MVTIRPLAAVLPEPTVLRCCVGSQIQNTKLAKNRIAPWSHTRLPIPSSRHTSTESLSWLTLIHRLNVGSRTSALSTVSVLKMWRLNDKWKLSGSSLTRRFHVPALCPCTSYSAKSNLMLLQHGEGMSTGRCRLSSNVLKSFRIQSIRMLKLFRLIQLGP